MATKYRPYFTVEEIDHILSALKQTSSNITLIRYLDDFAHKISRESLKPNLTLKPTLEDRLELDAPRAKSIDSLVALKSQAYQKWLTSPSKCTSSEIARVLMHRYENDLMSPEEEAEYESKIDKGY